MSRSDLFASEIVRKRLRTTIAFAHEFGSRGRRGRVDVSEGRASLPAGEIVTNPRTISACAEDSYHRAWWCRALERGASGVVPPGFLVDAAWLKRFGIDPKSIHDYAERGWLERVVRGVYRRPLPHTDQAGRPLVRPETDWQLSLLSIQWIMEHDVHLGGLSALGFHGLAHYLPLGGGERVYLYGEVPSWLARLPGKAQFVVRSRVLFGEDLTGVENAKHQFESEPGAGAEHGPTVSPWRWPLKVSSPERAILEALDELPAYATFDNLDMIFQGQTNLRPKRLMTLLRACRSIKVKRLFFVFADRHAHAWVRHLDKSAIDFGSGPRALVKGGKLHPVYRIYVPEALLPEDMDEDASHA